MKNFSQISFFFATVILSGCALFGGGSESLQRAKGYQVIAPKEWVAKNTESESDQAFQTPSGNIATITSSCKRNTNVSLEVLTRHLLLGARHIVTEKKELYKTSAGEGLYSSVKATLDGVEFHLELFVLSKNSCIFDFSLVSPKKISVLEKESFVTFFKSLTYGTN